MRSSSVSPSSRTDFQIGEQVGEQLHVPLVDGLELRQLLLGLAVVRQVVIAVGDRRAVDLTTGVPTLLSISVIARVESVSKARRARSYMSFTLSMYCAGLAGSSGRAGLDRRLGLVLPSARHPAAGAPGRGRW